MANLYTKITRETVMNHVLVGRVTRPATTNLEIYCVLCGLGFNSHDSIGIAMADADDVTKGLCTFHFEANQCQDTD